MKKFILGSTILVLFFTGCGSVVEEQCCQYDKNIDKPVNEQVVANLDTSSIPQENETEEKIIKDDDQNKTIIPIITDDDEKKKSIIKLDCLKSYVVDKLDTNNKIQECEWKIKTKEGSKDIVAKKIQITVCKGTYKEVTLIVTDNYGETNSTVKTYTREK